jgi:hypothetical protein
MRRGVLVAAAACLLAGPTVLAFFSGGFFAEPRLIAAIVAWAFVLALTAAGEPPLPRRLPGALALGGLAFLTVWSALSILWAPLGGPAADAVQRLLLYLAALAVGITALGVGARAVEPALAAGATLVIAYGLAGRLLPDIVELSRSDRAGGRLEQPITYWNAEGALAAVGVVLCARLAGDGSRPTSMRALGAAAAVPLGAGVYLSYSRGAIAAALAGLVVLVAAAPSVAQVRAAALVLGAGVAAAAVAEAFPYVAALQGENAARDGALALVAMVATAAVAAAVATRFVVPSHERAPRSARRLPAIAAAAVVAAFAGLIAAGLGERPTAQELAVGAGAGRLTTASSNRYEYWRVGLQAFAQNPVVGLGAGGFRVEWLKERRIEEAVRDTHSLPIEIAAELGLPGLLGFAALVAGVALAARRSLGRHRALAAGATAAVTTWFLHACIDWDWQLPAVTLPAIALAGLLVALSEPRADRAALAPEAPAERTPDPARA